MCYGPEIESIYETIRKSPEVDIQFLRQNYQYLTEGDISSLIEAAVTVLLDLHYIERVGTQLTVVENKPWENIEVFKRLKKISGTENELEDNLNFVFSSLYNQIFVKPDKMFVTNIHYHVNNMFTKTMVGHEKINAWKRMMECWGLGRRVYSGFYALPHLTLLQEIIHSVGEWEGGIHPYCEKYIHPIIPCITSEGQIYKGIIFGLINLHGKVLEISYKQDLPFKSYGPNQEWNWIRIRKQVD